MLKRSGHGAIGGLGGTEAAVKWRFLDEDKSGFDVSMFPRVIFNVAQSSARRGLADDGTRFQIPFQASKTFGRFRADVEFGPLTRTVGPERIALRNCWRDRSGEDDNANGGASRHLTHEFHPRRFDGELRSPSRVHGDSYPARITWTRDSRSRPIARLYRLLRRAVARLRGVSCSCSCSTEGRRLRVSSMRFRSRLLRENQDQRDNYHQER